MRMRTAVIASLLTLLPAASRASFERAAEGTRSRAMGSAFVPLGDDASTLFVNPAGLVTASGFACYADYTEPPGNEITSAAKGCIVAPAWRGAFGAGWHRLGRGDGSVENLFTAGAAWTILEGTPGSFLSAGANFVVGRVLFGSACGPCGARASEHHYACDFGIMLRPLPIVSFGYAVTNAGLSGFEREGERWPRVSRWGVSYFWEQKVVISYAEERDGEETRRNYGFIVSTALPLELLGGFSDGSASFGVRCAIDRFRAAAAFRSGGGEGTEIMVSLEAVFGLARGGEAQ